MRAKNPAWNDFATQDVSSPRGHSNRAMVCIILIELNTRHALKAIQVLEISGVLGLAQDLLHT
jgi:hypothetical protein